MASCSQASIQPYPHPTPCTAVPGTFNAALCRSWSQVLHNDCTKKKHSNPLSKGSCGCLLPRLMTQASFNVQQSRYKSRRRPNGRAACHTLVNSLFVVSGWCSKIAHADAFFPISKAISKELAMLVCNVRIPDV